MLAQHTAATGQAFTEEALRLIVARTAGQPWLVNALCREACFDDKTGRDRSRPITEQAILEAQERLILARVTHLDNLAGKLREECVRRVIEPILAGADEIGFSEEDLSYARDLGLVALEQTRAYLDRCGAEAGHLIVFDRTPERTWEEKIFRRPPSEDGVPVTVWDM